MKAIDYNNLDLRNKTFLDFTDNQNVISELVGDGDWFLSNLTEMSRGTTFWEFRDYTSDGKLIQEIEKVFGEYKLIFDE